MHIVQDLRGLSLWNAWEMRRSELLYSFLYLTGDHCWVRPFGQQALNIWLPIYSTVVWVSSGEIQAQVLATRQQSILTHQPHLQKGDITTVTVFCKCIGLFPGPWDFIVYKLLYVLRKIAKVPLKKDSAPGKKYLKYKLGDSSSWSRCPKPSFLLFPLPLFPILGQIFCSNNLTSMLSRIPSNPPILHI